MTARTLVAGIGNIFLRDDGFGVEVASQLAGTDLPAGVTVVDYGIRGMHLAYDLANGYDAAILIDATPRGAAPGTIYVIEPDLGSSPAGGRTDQGTGTADRDAGTTAESVPPAGTGGAEDTGSAGAGPGIDAALAASPLFDAHGMQPDVVFGMLDMLGGGRPERILVVGCEPASVEEGMGLSEPVAAAVDEAVRVVLELVAGGCDQPEQRQGAAATDAHGASSQRN